jgi:phosphate-selective porin OprO/OprP
MPSMLIAQNPAGEEAEDQAAGQQEPAKGLQFKFKDRPSFRFGENFRLDIKTKWHLDFQRFFPLVANPPETTDTFILRRARLGLKGKVTKFFNYEIEREMRGTLGDEHPEHPWKDVYVDFQPFSFVHFKAGKFKIPFGMEQNTSADRLDLVRRSNVTNTLTPARERGAMLHGRFLKHLGYEFGIFRFDGENSNVQDAPTGGRTYAWRISGEPLRYLKLLPETIRHVYLGFAATSGEMFEGQNGIHGQTLSNFTYLERVFVKGDRRRFGAEAAWSEGSFGIKGEYIRVSEQRQEQGIRVNDLPDKISRGWYVTATWVALGKMKSKGDEPKDPFLTGKGFGALELSARLDVLTFYSASQPGLPSRSPRAANILPNSDRTWTVGPTWYINHFVKLQAYAAREWVTDIEKNAVQGRNVFWTGIIRLQLAM